MASPVSFPRTRRTEAILPASRIAASPVSGFTLEGKIKDFIYQGSVVKTAVDLKGGMEVKYSRFEQDQTVKEGAAVYVCWKPEKAVAIKKFGQGAV